MDEQYYIEKILPHMFYMPPGEIWRFQMNAARAMGNSLNPEYKEELKRCLAENQDERVREMATWALEKLNQG
jgi:epoxyqueuosine reductase